MATLYHNNTQIKNLYYNNTKVKQAYLNNVLVYKSETTWKKYNVVNKTVWKDSVYETYPNVILANAQGYDVCKTNREIDQSTGRYVPTTIIERPSTTKMIGMYFLCTGVDLWDEAPTYRITLTNRKNKNCNKAYEQTGATSGRLYLIQSVTQQEMGTYIGDVVSENENAYPTNGVHTDGYWYVKQ